MQTWNEMSREQRRDYVTSAKLLGLSAADAAAQAATTRNAILGVAHRAKIALGGRPRPKKAKTKAPDNSRPAPITKPAPVTKPMPVFEQHVEPTPSATTLTLTPRTCAFPMFSDDELRDTVKPSALAFCGAPVERGHYCAVHYPRVYTPVPRRVALRK